MSQLLSPFRTASLALLLSCVPAVAHEFWIEPDAHQVAAGEKVSARLRIGQNYKGEVYPYLSSQFRKFTLTDEDGTRDYEGDQGDQPALTTTLETPGLTVVTYHSTASKLIYKDWATFVKYTTNEGLTGAVEAHQAAGLPEKGFREDYSRIAKSLVQVGPVRAGDRDAAQGYPLELVALSHPGDAAVDTLTVRLLREGKPQEDVQVAIFAKDAEGVARTNLRTDAAGEVAIPLTDGTRSLLNAVWLARSEKDGVDYESDWASLTFARP